MANTDNLSVYATPYGRIQDTVDFEKAKEFKTFSKVDDLLQNTAYGLNRQALYVFVSDDDNIGELLGYALILVQRGPAPSTEVVSVEVKPSAEDLPVLELLKARCDALTWAAQANFTGEVYETIAAGR